MGKAFLAVILLIGVTGHAVADVRDGETAFWRQQYEKAAKMLSPEAARENPRAQLLLGRMYAEGNGVKKDDKRSLRLFRQAARQGSIEAIEEVIARVSFAFGDFTDEDLILTELAAAKGSLVALNTLAANVFHGLEPAEWSPGRGIELYTLAAKLGSADAAYALHRIYATTKQALYTGGKTDPAAFWYDQYRLLLEREPFMEAQFKADRGNPSGMFDLAIFLRDGEYGPADEVGYNTWLTRAGLAGHDPAMRQLVKDAKAKNDVALRQRWLTHAAEVGERDAQRDLAVGAYKAKDYALARRWFEALADQDQADAMNYLGIMAAQGHGGAVDLPKAAFWYRKAAGLGYALGQLNIGSAYLIGRGVPNDFLEAYKWLNLAAGGLSTPNLLGRASEQRDLAAKSLSAEQIRDMQNVTRAWVPEVPRSSAVVAKAAAAPPPSQTSQKKLRTGTGFFISSQGHVLTNAHVTAGCARVVVAAADEVGLEGQVIRTDSSNDLALIKLSTGSETAYASFSPANLSVGAPIYVFGFPLSGILSSAGSFAAGNVSSLSGPANDTRLVQISVPVQPGNSGGPVLDGNGTVVGVVRAKLDESRIAAVAGTRPEGIAFAIQGSTARDFLRAADVEPAVTKPGRAVLTPETIATRARQFTVRVECRS